MARSLDWETYPMAQGGKKSGWPLPSARSAMMVTRSVVAGATPLAFRGARREAVAS